MAQRPSTSLERAAATTVSAWQRFKLAKGRADMQFHVNDAKGKNAAQYFEDARAALHLALDALEQTKAKGKR